MTDLAAEMAGLQPKLARYALALTRNRDAAEDLVQDTLTHALSRQHLFQPDSDLRAWLFTIMHNLFVNGVRKSVRRGVNAGEEALASIPVAASQEDGIRARELRRALSMMPRDMVAVLIFVAANGERYEAAAEHFGVPPGTIRSRLSRGRTILRTLMGVDQ